MRHSDVESVVVTDPLTVSDLEVGRYLMMADRAKASNAELWDGAGDVPWAIVGDVTA